MPVIPTLGRLRPEDDGFEMLLQSTTLSQHKTKTGHVTQRQNTCLAFARSRVLFPTPHTPCTHVCSHVQVGKDDHTGLLKGIYFYLSYEGFAVCKSVPHMPAAFGGLKKVSDPWNWS